jgi:hypothetical protein
MRGGELVSPGVGFRGGMGVARLVRQSIVQRIGWADVILRAQIDAIGDIDAVSWTGRRGSPRCRP